MKKQNNGQSLSKILVLNACIWLARTNTQNLHTILYIFACNKDLCSVVLTNLLGDVFLSFLPHLNLEEGIWEVTSAKGSPKYEFYMLSCISLAIEQTDKIGCNMFPARMTCAELWCQIVWEHFPQLCVKFQPWLWSRQLGNMFMTTPYF